MSEPLSVSVVGKITLLLERRRDGDDFGTFYLLKWYPDEGKLKFKSKAQLSRPSH